MTANTRKGLVHQRGCGAGPEPCTCEAPFPMGRDEAADRIAELEHDLAVAVDALCQADGDGVEGNSWFVKDYCEVFTDDPATLARLLQR